VPIAIDPNQTWDYVLKEDRELQKDKQTVFVLGALSASAESEIEDSAGSLKLDMSKVAVGDLQSTWHSNTNQNAIKILRAGLKGVQYFYNDKNELIEFDTEKAQGKDVVSDKFLTRLTRDQRIELANAITEKIKMTQEEEENLS